MSGPGLGVGGAIIRRREEEGEDEGKGRRKSPKVEVVTSSRAKMGKLGGRTGIKYPIKKKKRNEKRIHKSEVESESGSASKTAVPLRYCSTEGKKNKVLFCTTVSMGQAGVAEACAYTMEGVPKTKKVR